MAGSDQTPEFSPLRLAVCGLYGRMGQQVLAAAQDQQGFEVVLGIERDPAESSTRVGRQITLVAMERAQEALGELAVEVVIDFSAPAATAALARACLGAGAKPLVVGSTGLDEEARAQLGTLAEHAAVLVAPNLSVGANVVFELVPELVRGFAPPPQTGVEITELHHRHKRDHPSGTAVRLVAAVAAALGLEPQGAVHGEGSPPSREQPIGVHAVRLGEIVGEHRVLVAGDAEEVEIIHRVRSRRAFAEGALLAARFVAGAPAGYYAMPDVVRARPRGAGPS